MATMPTRRTVSLSRIAALTLLTFVVAPSLVFAGEAATTQSLSSGTTYNFMAPLGNSLTSADLSTYLQGAVKLLIGLAGVLAVLMIVVCGIKMMGTPSASAKSEAKECVWNAIFGVLLAVGAWILLYQINPALLSSDMNVTILPPPPPPPAVNTTAPAGTPTGCGGSAPQAFPTAPGWYFKYCDATTQGTYVYAGTSAQACATLSGTINNPSAAPVGASDPGPAPSNKTLMQVNGQTCFQVAPPGAPNAPTTPGTPYSGPSGEADIRRALCNNDSCVGANAEKIQVNKAGCRTDPNNGEGCTDVRQLGGDAITMIKALRDACQCVVMITGGTERWPHSYTAGSSSNHDRGNSVVDLWFSAPMDAKIMAAGNPSKPSFGSFTRWKYLNFWFTREANARGPHWHACLAGTTASYCKD